MRFLNLSLGQYTTQIKSAIAYALVNTFSRENIICCVSMVLQAYTYSLTLFIQCGEHRHIKLLISMHKIQGLRQISAQAEHRQQAVFKRIMGVQHRQSIGNQIVNGIKADKQIANAIKQACNQNKDRLYSIRQRMLSNQTGRDAKSRPWRKGQSNRQRMLSNRQYGLIRRQTPQIVTIVSNLVIHRAILSNPKILSN